MPTGYILGPNDQVSVDVFGEDDLRVSGRLNPEGNLNVRTGVGPFGRTDYDAGSFKTHRPVRPRLSGQTEDQCHASQLRKAALCDYGPGRSPRHHRHA